VTVTEASPGAGQGLSLVRRLCRELRAQGITYCHWKSNASLDRSARGDNDLDLLVLRRDAQRFTETLSRLGFKEARPPSVREIPGVQHYYGLDTDSGRLVHVHSQYELVVGDDTTKNYRLPIEADYLDSAVPGPLFSVPSPEFELVVFVIRMVLKHATWDALLCGRGSLSRSEASEHADLVSRADPAAVRRTVARCLPSIGPDLWERCARCLDAGTSARARASTAQELQRRLAGEGGRRPQHDTALRLWRRGSWGVRRYVLRRPTRKRLVSGGAVVAIVGGDGAGKSSVVHDLSAWLSTVFLVRDVHMGKPPHSVTTRAVRASLAVARRVGLFQTVPNPTAVPTGSDGRLPGHPWLAWHTLKARDRYREYARVKRFAGRGGIVVCDRYPLAALRLMDGARTGWALELPGLGSVGRFLAGREKRYYERIYEPDLLIVLRLDPDLAVRRKHDEEAGYVRRRSEEIWQLDWTNTGVVVDAARDRADVLSEIKTIVWSRL
jgi:thymidylate kinase